MPPVCPTFEERAASTKKRKHSLETTQAKKYNVDVLKAGGAKIKKMNRNDLEKLVLHKIVEAITARSKFGELSKKFQKMSVDYNKMKEKAVALQKQLADLTEVTKRIKVLDETKTVRIPKITRSVGLQVTSKSKAELQMEEKKTAVINIGHDENSPELRKSSVQEIIKKDPLDLLKHSRIKKVEVAKKSTGGKNSKNDYFEDSTKPIKSQQLESKLPDDNEPLSLNVKKSNGMDGIVITWAKKLNNFELDSIVNYELEGSKGEKNLANLKWSRIGNAIKPLPLPMACNLNNFKTGVLYYFRVKLVTKDNSFYSNISSIIL